MHSSLESTRGLRVLVVEDEALIAEELLERLTHLGCRVVGIHDTAEHALQAVATQSPDLVLMDIRLKGQMDGIEAASYIYQQFQLPVVYLTAHSDPTTLERAMTSAPFGYVLKPFQERDLLVAIELARRRHAVEQHLRTSELPYAATLTSIADGVIATDMSGRVTFMNPVAEALTGWRFADAQGLLIEQVFPIVDEANQTPIANPIREALILQGVVRLSKPSLLIDHHGAPLLIDDSAAIIRDAKGNACGAVLAFRDMRQRRLAEDALRQAEAEVHQAQKMEAIGQLAGGVAHDFNNLLAIINGYCELLMDSEPLDETTQGILAEIHKAGGRAASLIRQLLAFSRKQLLKPQMLDLNVLIVNMTAMIHRVIGQDVHMSTMLAPHLEPVYVDPAQLEQLVLNLVVNARDAMPQGGQLTFTTYNLQVDETGPIVQPEMMAGRYVLLIVHDTGVGMDETTKAHLFEPFFTTKEVGKGTGLGLASVYGLVKQSGGHISVDSEPGRGTTFTIYLPAADQANMSSLRDARLKGSKLPPTQPI